MFFQFQDPVLTLMNNVKLYYNLTTPGSHSKTFFSPGQHSCKSAPLPFYDSTGQPLLNHNKNNSDD